MFPFSHRVQLGLPYVGLPAFGQRGNPVTELHPADPGSHGSQPRSQICLSLAENPYRQEREVDALRTAQELQRQKYLEHEKEQEHHATRYRGHDCGL